MIMKENNLQCFRFEHLGINDTITTRSWMRWATFSDLEGLSLSRPDRGLTFIWSYKKMTTLTIASTSQRKITSKYRTLYDFDSSSKRSNFAKNFHGSYRLYVLCLWYLLTVFSQYHYFFSVYTFINNSYVIPLKLHSFSYNFVQGDAKCIWKLFYFTELYSNDYIIYHNKYYFIIIVMIIKIIIILSKIRTRHNNFFN